MKRSKVLQVVIDLDGSPELFVGLRVDVFFRPVPEGAAKQTAQVR